MTFNPSHLKPDAPSTFLPDGRQAGSYTYFTHDPLTEVQKDGYFDDAVKYFPAVGLLTVVSAPEKPVSKKGEAEYPVPEAVTGLIYIRDRKPTAKRPAVREVVFEPLGGGAPSAPVDTSDIEARLSALEAAAAGDPDGGSPQGE